MTQLLGEQSPLNLICLGLLGVLLLRRLVRMDGHHELRVVLLTGLFWVPAIYLFMRALSWMVGDFYYYPMEFDQGVFPITES